MKYLMMIKSSERYRSETIPPALMEAMGELMTQEFKSGRLKETAGLTPTAQGFRVRSSGGKLTVTDGPFAEAKEVVGGFALVEVASHQEAVEFSRVFMDLHVKHWPAFEGECEVRPIEAM